MGVSEPLGELEQLAGAAEAEARVGPRERLVAEDGVALEVPDRLEGDVELAVLEQLAEAADAVGVASVAVEEISSKTTTALPIVRLAS